MTDKIIIQSSDSEAKLILSSPGFDIDLSLDHFVVTVSNTGLNASSRVDAYMSEGIVELFEDIAKNWRGWKGEKSAGTSDFGLNCTSDMLGHTFMSVTLTSQVNNWDVEMTLRLDAGQLDDVAKKFKDFLTQHRL